MHACKRIYTHSMICGYIRESAAALSPLLGTRSLRNAHLVIKGSLGRDSRSSMGESSIWVVLPNNVPVREKSKHF